MRSAKLIHDVLFDLRQGSSRLEVGLSFLHRATTASAPAERAQWAQLAHDSFRAVGDRLQPLMDMPSAGLSKNQQRQAQKLSQRLTAAQDELRRLSVQFQRQRMRDALDSLPSHTLRIPARLDAHYGQNAAARELVLAAQKYNRPVAVQIGDALMWAQPNETPQLVQQRTKEAFASRTAPQGFQETLRVIQEQTEASIAKSKVLSASKKPAGNWQQISTKGLRQLTHPDEIRTWVTHFITQARTHPSLMTNPFDDPTPAGAEKWALEVIELAAYMGEVVPGTEDFWNEEVARRRATSIR